MKSRALSVLGLAVLALGGALLVASDDVDDKELSRIVEVLDVDPGEAFADVGAGDGRYSLALAREVGESGSIYATDVDPEDLETIEKSARREKLGNVEVVRGTQETTGLPDACCHGILLRHVYHHFQDPAAMRAGLKRALREGGLLLVIDFGPKKTWSRPEGVPASRDGHGIHKEVLVSEMELAGFALLQDLVWKGEDYGLLFRAVPVPD